MKDFNDKTQIESFIYINGKLISHTITDVSYDWQKNNNKDNTNIKKLKKENNHK